jgi:hypothetical protein
MKRKPDTAAGLRAWAAAFGKPPPGKEKAARPGKGEAAYQNNIRQANHAAQRHHRQRGEVDVVLAGWLIFALALLVLNVGGVLS